VAHKKFVEAAQDYYARGCQELLSDLLQRIDREAREECAKVCEEYADNCGDTANESAELMTLSEHSAAKSHIQAANRCALEIRAQIPPEAPAEGERDVSDPCYDKPLPDYGELISVDRFRAAVLAGNLIDYDGTGHPVRDGRMDGKHYVYPSDPGSVPEDATHIMWFNR